ncbi:flagellin [Vibrio cidicii]|nr:flagellin [Vibrio cidicii]
MALTVQSNIVAAEARNRLRITESDLTNSMAKLSSGQKINVAKDDSAGLQISNRLSTQSRGLDVSMRNANDAVSILQVTEGAIAEYTSNVQRIRDLALQSVNGTNSQADIDAIEKEIRALGDELHRITQTSSYGDLNLLNGTKESIRFQIGSKAGEAMPFALPNLDALNSERFIRTTPSTYTGDPIPLGWRTAKGDYIDFLFIKENGEKKTRVELPQGQTIEGVVNYLNNQFDDKVRFFLTDLRDEDGVEKNILSYAYEKGSDYSKAEIFGIAGERFANLTKPDGSRGYLLKGGNPFVAFGLDRSLTELINHDFDHIDDYDPNDTDFINDRNALIYMCDLILHQVNSFQGSIGSTQNRLEKAINNLSSQGINIDASNSRIKDTDFAKEATQMVKDQIRTNSTTSMLVQANSLPKSISSLLTN